MIRMSEVVLGHSDNYCDQSADAIVAACYRVDARAYCQVQIGVWNDRVSLRLQLAKCSGREEDAVEQEPS